MLPSAKLLRVGRFDQATASSGVGAGGPTSSMCAKMVWSMTASASLRSAEGLEQEFNSLDAQREACLAALSGYGTRSPHQRPSSCGWEDGALVTPTGIEPVLQP